MNRFAAGRDKKPLAIREEPIRRVRRTDRNELKGPLNMGD